MKTFKITFCDGEQKNLKGNSAVNALVRNGYGHVKICDVKFSEVKKRTSK